MNVLARQKKSRNPYSVSERVIYFSTYSLLKMQKMILSVFRESSASGRSDDFVDRPIRRFGLIVFICVLIIAYMAWSALSVLGNTERFQEAFGSSADLAYNIYKFHRTYVFNDPATFTTLTIGITAGAISIAAFASSGLVERTRVSISDLEGVRKAAIAFGSVATLVFLWQLVVCSGWLFWEEPSRGGLSPIIVVDCLLGFIVCACMASLVGMPASYLIVEVAKIDREIESVESVLHGVKVRRRRFPLWNVRNLYVSFSLALGWSISAIVFMWFENESAIDLFAFMAATVLMSVVCGLIYFQFVTAGSRVNSRLHRFGLINGFIHFFFALMFSISIASYFSGGNDLLFLLLMAGWLVSFRLPLRIIRCGVIEDRVLQGSVNVLIRDLRVLRVKRRRAIASLKVE